MGLFIHIDSRPGSGRVFCFAKQRELMLRLRKDGVKLPDDEILLVNRYVNYDGVCIDYGIFVDSNGGVYSL